VALVHCNDQIITDEFHSTIFVTQITNSVEVYGLMPLLVLKQVILRLFVQMMASHMLLIYIADA